MIGEASSR